MPNIPQFTLAQKTEGVSPSGPKVAALMANLKCELWNAVHDTNVLPYYNDTPSLSPHQLKRPPTDDRRFTLSNIFEEIAYVAEAQFTLDVTTTNVTNPSLNFINPYSSTTNLTLSVAGQIQDVPHRTLNIYTSVDSERLIPSMPVNALYDKIPSKSGEELPPDLEALGEPALDPSTDTLCNGGTELGGELGLKEVLATSLIAERMNDVAVFASKGEKGVTLRGGPAPDNFGNYAFGQIATQVDFTITEGISGGPLWTLSKFKGPGGGSGGPFVGISRQVKDTLVVTFIPVCIREKYFPERWDPERTRPDPKDKFSQVFDPNRRLVYPLEYEPEMGVGTPGWANYLPPCRSSAGQEAKMSAPAKGQFNNDTLQIEGLTQQLTHALAIP